MREEDERGRKRKGQCRRKKKKGSTITDRLMKTFFITDQIDECRASFLPRIGARYATEDVDDYGEDEDQNGHVTIAYFAQRKIQQHVIWHYLKEKRFIKGLGSLLITSEQGNDF